MYEFCGGPLQLDGGDKDAIVTLSLPKTRRAAEEVVASALFVAVHL